MEKIMATFGDRKFLQRLISFRSNSELDQSIPHGIHKLRLRGCGFLGQPPTFRHHKWDRGWWHHCAAEAQEQEQIDFYLPGKFPHLHD